MTKWDREPLKRACVCQSKRAQLCRPRPPITRRLFGFLNSADAIAYHNRGVAHYHNRDVDGALADFDQAIRLSPTLAMAYFNRGNALLEKKEFDRAIADLDEATKLKPELVHAYVDRGFAYIQKLDVDKAIKDFNTAINLDPKFARAYSNRAAAHAAKGNISDARSDFCQVINLALEDIERDLQLRLHGRQASSFRGSVPKASTEQGAR